MASIRKTKKTIKIGAANEALNHRLVKLDVPEMGKVSDKSRANVMKKAVKGINASRSLKGKGAEKLGDTYRDAKVAATKKLAKKTDLQIVAKASKTR